MDWRKVPGLVCMHCGRDMESAIGTSRGSIVIVGLEPMSYRHADDHTEECVITRHYRVEPYSAWGQQSAWEALKKEEG